MTNVSPRAIVHLASATAGLLASGSLDRLAAQQPCADGAAAGTLIRDAAAARADGVLQPFGVKFGGPGLDARQVTDLSQLAADRLITPNGAAFIRTEWPAAAARRPSPWTDRDHRSAGARSVTDRRRPRRVVSRPMGTHLLECAGQQQPGKLRLDERRAWDGVPLVDLLSRLQPRAAGGRRARSRGSTTKGSARRSSCPARAGSCRSPALDRLGAFLARADEW